MRYEYTETDDIRRYVLTTDEGKEYRQEYKMMDTTCATMRLDYVDGKLVGKYIPCARASDGLVGWYDLINKVFLPFGDVQPTLKEFTEESYELKFVEEHEYIDTEVQPK